MNEVNVPLPAGLDAEEIARRIDDCCADERLTVTQRGSLARYPSSVHWHLKQGTQPGTLEITFWPAQERLWLSVRANRRGHWSEERVALFSSSLRRAVAGVD